MNTKTIPGFFQANFPEQLFSTLERVFRRYQRTRGKRIEDIFFLVLGLAHLRDWIAPGYRQTAPPSSAAEQFSHELSKLAAYKTIRGFANQGKHQGDRGELPIAQGVEYEPIDLHDVDVTLSMNRGLPIAYFIAGRNAAELFSQVLAFYRKHWFSLPFETRYGD